MSSMFSNATSFFQILCSWKLKSTTKQENMFVENFPDAFKPNNKGSIRNCLKQIPKFEECVICTEPLDNFHGPHGYEGMPICNYVVEVCNNNHKCHRICIAKWCKNKPTCPVCIQNIPKPCSEYNDVNNPLEDVKVKFEDLYKQEDVVSQKKIQPSAKPTPKPPTISYSENGLKYRFKTDFETIVPPDKVETGQLYSLSIAKKDEPDNQVELIEIILTGRHTYKYTDNNGFQYKIINISYNGNVSGSKVVHVDEEGNGYNQIINGGTKINRSNRHKNINNI